MTAQDLTERYLSDVRAAKALFEAEKMDRFELDATVEKLDNNLFESFAIFPTLEVSSSVERIAAYTHKE